MDWLLAAKVVATLLAVIAFVGVLLGFPTTLLAWLGLVLVAVADGFQTLSGWWLVATFVGCLLTEFADNLLSAWMVRKFGASKGSMVAAWVGGLSGAVVGGAIAGLAGLIGSALGALVGAFAGAYGAVYFWERRAKRSPDEAARAAWGTVIGRLLGIVVKLIWLVALTVLCWRA
ncbi:MAG: DUF456 domain-containing protein [Armatimonadota bacterium]|nr:DUF456 domain-containing protein [Armatimonadota bacterium]MDT7972122.1 DUF456 domain-containing protein [Armatimonadota bacterium]